LSGAKRAGKENVAMMLIQARRNAGFECIDVLLRDGGEVILAAAKP
jgi:hypothetical protein